MNVGTACRFNVAPAPRSNGIIHAFDSISANGFLLLKRWDRSITSLASWKNQRDFVSRIDVLGEIHSRDAKYRTTRRPQCLTAYRRLPKKPALNLGELVTRHDIPLGGVLHLGANDGSEAGNVQSLRVPEGRLG